MWIELEPTGVGMESVVRCREIRKHAFYVGACASLISQKVLWPTHQSVTDQRIAIIRLLLRDQAKRSRDFEGFAKIAAGIEDMQAAECPQLIVAITQLLCDFERARPDGAEVVRPTSGIETRCRERDPKF